jgi:hypothetical protein
VGQSYQVLVTRHRLLVFEFEEHLMLSALIDGIENLDNDWDFIYLFKVLLCIELITNYTLDLYLPRR